MTDFRRVTDDLSVSPQISLDDLAAAKSQGFALVINNRPDGEAPDQPPSAEVEAAARAAGLGYVHLPVLGRATPEQIQAMHDAVAAAGGPVLAFCRSGTRSITIWSLSELLLNGADRGRLVKLGEAAGYDLSGLPG